MNDEEFKAQLADTIRSTVYETFQRGLQEAEEKVDDIEEENDEDNLKEADEDELDEEDDEKVEETSDKDEELKESLDVVATKRGKERYLSIASFKALTQLAKNGEYDSFVVTDKGVEVEYIVSNGRLVEV